MWALWCIYVCPSSWVKLHTPLGTVYWKLDISKCTRLSYSSRTVGTPLCESNTSLYFAYKHKIFLLFFLQAFLIHIDLPRMEPLWNSREGNAFFLPGLSYEVPTLSEYPLQPGVTINHTCVSLHLQLYTWYIPCICVNTWFQSLNIIQLISISLLLNLNAFIMNRHNHLTTFSSLLEKSSPSIHAMKYVLFCYKFFPFISL